MVRYIDLELKRNVSDKDSYKLGKPVTGVNAVALIKGKEQIGSVVIDVKRNIKIFLKIILK